MNPNVQKPVRRILDCAENIFLIEPLEYLPFIYLMTQSHIILTDSGGIQKKAPYLGKPVFVMKEVTERPELIKVGIAKLVASNKRRIIREAQSLLDNPKNTM